MAVRRKRARLVLDTSVLAAAFLARDRRSPNLHLYRMWGERRIQLIVTDELEEEYLGVLAGLGASATHRQRFAQRLRTRSTVSWVRPDRAFRLSRDPSDDFLLSVAVAGQAEFLVTNDRDLLSIPAQDLRGYGFRIVTAADALTLLRTHRP